MSMNNISPSAIELVKHWAMDLIVASLSLVIGVALVFRQEVTFMMVGA